MKHVFAAAAAYIGAGLVGGGASLQLGGLVNYLQGHVEAATGFPTDGLLATGSTAFLVGTVMLATAAPVLRRLDAEWNYV